MREMGHHSCCNKQKVKRGLWSPEEDEKLANYISTYGHGCWSSVPKLAGFYLIKSIFYEKYISVPKLAGFRFFYLILGCRSAEMWKELQAKMDKLSKT